MTLIPPVSGTGEIILREVLIYEYRPNMRTARPIAMSVSPTCFIDLLSL